MDGNDAAVKDDSVADRARLTMLVLAQGFRGLAGAARRPIRGLMARRSRVPQRLLIAPQDIRTADPTVAADIYSGYFVFDGKAVNARGASPFDLPAPTESWAAALAGFGWLRHLKAADTALARVNARALVGDWIASAGRPGRAPGWKPEVVARRLLAWLSQSPLILEGADAVFYRRFMRSLSRQGDTLVAALDRGLGGAVRLVAIVALAELALCAEGRQRLQRRASRLLSAEIGRQILADGGHVSRNPGLLLDLLMDLLPLRQAYTARGVEPPPSLLTAIDRMIPMLRALRHGDGSLALFNGMGVTRLDALATVLAYDDARGAALSNAPYSGYQRLEAGAAVLIVDAGPPPPPGFAERAHAGTLAFEFSIGPQRLVVNCGAADSGQPAALEASRATAAHSTLVLADRSSSRFAARGPLGGLLYSGPKMVSVERIEMPGHSLLNLSHDGYAGRFGVLHGRRLWLSEAGDRLAGEDRVLPRDGRMDRLAGLPFTIRFHLHASLRTTPIRRGTAVLIAFPTGERWLFEAGGLPVEVEESISFAQIEGPRRIDQLVVRGHAPETEAVAWSLSRETEAVVQA